MQNLVFKRILWLGLAVLRGEDERGQSRVREVPVRAAGASWLALEHFTLGKGFPGRERLGTAESFGGVESAVGREVENALGGLGGGRGDARRGGGVVRCERGRLVERGAARGVRRPERLEFVAGVLHEALGEDGGLLGGASADDLVHEVGRVDARLEQRALATQNQATAHDNFKIYRTMSESKALCF